MATSLDCEVIIPAQVYCWLPVSDLQKANGLQSASKYPTKKLLLNLSIRDLGELPYFFQSFATQRLHQQSFAKWCICFLNEVKQITKAQDTLPSSPGGQELLTPSTASSSASKLLSWFPQWHSTERPNGIHSLISVLQMWVMLFVLYHRDHCQIKDHRNFISHFLFKVFKVY